MEWPVIFGLAVLSVAVLAVCLVGWVRRHRRATPTSPFASRRWTAMTLGAEPVEYRFVPPAYNKGRETRPPMVELRVPGASAGLFFLTEETSHDRRLKRLGLTGEARLGIPEIDGRFFVATPLETTTSRYFRDSRVLSRFQRLVELGVTELECQGGSLLARWKPFRQDVNQESLPEVEAAAEPLAEMGRWIGNVFRASDQERQGRYLSVRRITGSPALVVMGVVAGVLALLASLSVYAFYTPLDGTVFAWAVGPWIAGALALWLFGLRGMARRFHLPARAVYVLLASGGWITGNVVVTSFTWGNGHLDRSPPVEHVAEVASRWYRTHKRNRSYFIGVRSWRDPAKQYTLRVTEDQYRSLASSQPGPRVKVVVRQGEFGVEWVVRHRVLDSVGRSNSPDRKDRGAPEG